MSHGRNTHCREVISSDTGTFFSQAAEQPATWRAQNRKYLLSICLDAWMVVVQTGCDTTGWKKTLLLIPVVLFLELPRKHLNNVDAAFCWFSLLFTDLSLVRPCSSSVLHVETLLLSNPTMGWVKARGCWLNCTCSCSCTWFLIPNLFQGKVNESGPTSSKGNESVT